MPKFKSEEAQQAFKDKMEDIRTERRSICANLIIDALPKTEKEAMPKRKVFERAVASWQTDHKDLKAGTFLSTHADFFVTEKTLANYWPDVQDILADDGIFVGRVNGRHGGVYATDNPRAIAQAAEDHRNSIKGSAERYNWRAEHANKRKYMQLPVVAIQLLLPEPAR